MYTYHLSRMIYIPHPHTHDMRHDPLSYCHCWLSYMCSLFVCKWLYVKYMFVVWLWYHPQYHHCQYTHDVRYIPVYTIMVDCRILSFVNIGMLWFVIGLWLHCSCAVLFIFLQFGGSNHSAVGDIISCRHANIINELINRYLYIYPRRRGSMSQVGR